VILVFILGKLLTDCTKCTYRCPYYYYYLDFYYVWFCLSRINYDKNYKRN